ncbi:MAG: hypothetical protein ABEI74_04305 [Candidatus Pacearchaeota archaeon]
MEGEFYKNGESDFYVTRNNPRVVKAYKVNQQGVFQEDYNPKEFFGMVKGAYKRVDLESRQAERLENITKLSDPKDAAEIIKELHEPGLNESH